MCIRDSLDRADRVADRLNAERSGDRPLTAHDVIRACAARVLGLSSLIDQKDLDTAIEAERLSSIR